MTPRFLLIFSLVLAAVFFGEWFQFFRGFDTSQWPFSNWILVAFVLLAEASAVAIITLTVDRALPASGNRAPVKIVKPVKPSRRGSTRRR